LFAAQGGVSVDTLQALLQPGSNVDTISLKKSESVIFDDITNVLHKFGPILVSSFKVSPRDIH
jgi:hypothetical protein